MRNSPASQLSHGLAKAISAGRDRKEKLTSREEVLVNLLRKRALAQAMGALNHEAILRAQILWALPMVKPEG